jgi:hypothetical protein
MAIELSIILLVVSALVIIPSALLLWCMCAVSSRADRQSEEYHARELQRRRGDVVRTGGNSRGWRDI